MAENTYELVYFNYSGRADLSRLILDTVGATYTDVYVDDESFQKVKHEQRFEKVPRLTVTKPIGSVASRVIQHYLAEVFSLLPDGDALARAECMSNAFSLYDIQDRLELVRRMPTLDLRKLVHQQLLESVIPKALALHEKLFEQSGGPYYEGSKLTLPDLVLYALYLRFNVMFIERALINEAETPRLWTLVQTLDAGRTGKSVRARGEWGTQRWDRKQLQVVDI